MAAMMTVGELRKLIEDMPARAKIQPEWFKGPPNDFEPGVSVHGFKIGHDAIDPYLKVMVGLFYLEDEEDDDALGNSGVPGQQPLPTG
jgi:hypothetical protein